MVMTTEQAKTIKRGLDELATADPEAYHGMLDEAMYSIAKDTAPHLTDILLSAKQPDWWASA
jgi:hypothetical protein